MSLSDQILNSNDRYRAARRQSAGRGDPLSGGFERRLTVEPKRADSIMLWIAVGAVVFTIILTLAGAV
jgi:hypothetical protein